MSSARTKPLESLTSSLLTLDFQTVRKEDQNMEQRYIFTFQSVEARNYFVGRPFTFAYNLYHDAFKQ